MMRRAERRLAGAGGEVIIEMLFRYRGLPCAKTTPYFRLIWLNFFLGVLKMLGRCGVCGASLALAGRVHRCVTKPPEPVTKVGRPPLGDRAMTAAERKQRERARGRW